MPDPPGEHVGIERKGGRVGLEVVADEVLDGPVAAARRARPSSAVSLNPTCSRSRRSRSLRNTPVQLLKVVPSKPMPSSRILRSITGRSWAGLAETK
jgi:hypothetical protein